MKQVFAIGQSSPAVGALVALTVLFLSACAGMGAPPEEVVMERAQERMEYVLAEDYQAAYAFLSPGYRSGLSVNDYQKKMLTRRVQWNDAQVLQSECSSNTCKVKISVGYSVYGLVPGVRKMESQREIEEDWILVDGSWYFLPPG